MTIHSLSECGARYRRSFTSKKTLCHLITLETCLKYWIKGEERERKSEQLYTRCNEKCQTDLKGLNP